MLNKFISYSFPVQPIKNSVSTKTRSITFSYPCTSKDECHPFTVSFQKGTYQIECYGAGYGPSNSYTYGAYTKGLITFEQTQTLYLYIGASLGKFNALDPSASYERGTLPCGATDIRIDNGNYETFDSLKSRIMVAASGGGSDTYDGEFGFGGKLEGLRGLANISRNTEFQNFTDNPLIAPGGTQTSGGQCDEQFKTNCCSGKFGLPNYNPNSNDAGGFGGSGYYSGATYYPMGNGGGGSSFISGYKGCDAIDIKSTDFDKIYHTGQSIHYSGLSFLNPIMKSGAETKHDSDGKVIITLVSYSLTCNQDFSTLPLIKSLFYTFVLI